MTAWSKYLHDRVQRLEAHVFGANEATAIAETAPPNISTDLTSPIASDPTNPGDVVVPKQPPEDVEFLTTPNP